MLIDDMKPWLDPETGLYQAPDHGRDNLIVHTAALMAQLPSDLHLYMSAKVFHVFVADNMTVQRGLYRRYPGALLENSVDNLIALACANDYFAMQILQRGREYHWCFDVAYPLGMSFKYWYGRFIGFPPFIAMAAGKKIGIISQLLFSVACIYSAFSKYDNTSDKCLQYLMNKRVYGKYRLVDWSIRVWRKLMLRKYKAGLWELYFRYYGPGYPLTWNARCDFN